MNRLKGINGFLLALASTLFLYLSGVAIPMAGILLLALVPQPALAFGLRCGKGNGVGLILLATLLLFLLAGEELALGYSLLALMVLLLFFSFGRSWPIESVVVGTAAAMLATVYGALLYSFGSLSQLQDGLREVLKEKLILALKFYEKVGFSRENIEILRERGPQITEMTLDIMPALMLAGFILVILINLYLLSRRFPDQRPLYLSTSDLREWKSPEPLVWCFLLAGFFLLLPGWEMVRTLALNLLLIFAVFYFFQGLAIICYYFHHKNVPYFLRSLAYVLIVFEQIFTLFVVGLGLFDLWGDFRRLKKKDLTPIRQ